MLSHRLWTTAFGEDPAIVGKTLRLVSGNLPILGVASSEMDVPRGTDVWVNLQLNPQSTDHSFDGYLKVRPGTRPDVLASRMTAVAAALGREYPGPEGNRRAGYRKGQEVGWHGCRLGSAGVHRGRLPIGQRRQEVGAANEAGRQAVAVHGQGSGRDPPDPKAVAFDEQDSRHHRPEVLMRWSPPL